MAVHILNGYACGDPNHIQQSNNKKHLTFFVFHIKLRQFYWKRKDWKPCQNFQTRLRMTSFPVVLARDRPAWRKRKLSMEGISQCHSLRVLWGGRKSSSTLHIQKKSSTTSATLPQGWQVQIIPDHTTPIRVYFRHVLLGSLGILVAELRTAISLECLTLFWYMHYLNSYAQAQNLPDRFCAFLSTI